jgi:acetylornithine deacetylase/succinyl-diaminopimelate desuccinylase-like protein
MSSIARYLKRQLRRHLNELKELLAIPSISTDSSRASDVRRAAGWVRRRLGDAGCTRAEIHQTPRHPIVYGEWLGAPERPTMLVYGHYDVQPVDPLELWRTAPFRPTERNGRLYARGASDDKGQVMTHVNALEAHLSNGNCPLNVKFLIEGEEEIGSPNLHGFIARHRKKLACDAVVVSDTAMLGPDLPSICYGLRGLTYLELRVRGTTRDLHSGSFGGSVINPANALVKLLGSLKDARGRINVPGFYENVRRITAAERRRLASLPHSDRRFSQSFGAPSLFGEAGFSTLERIWCRPTLDINGIWGGFSGEGAKTVIPAEASAKISMRLVPDQTDREIVRKVTRHLKRIAPRSVEVSVRSLHGADPWLTSPEHPSLQAAGRALRRAFGRKALFVREGGSIPIVASFEATLKVPTLLLGFGLHDDNLHAPNEKMDLSNFFRGIETSAYLMEELSRFDGSGQHGARRTRKARGR